MCRRFLPDRRAVRYDADVKPSVSNTDIAKRPEQWDFRSITEDVLHLAIEYEYARSAAWVTKEFARWHEHQVPLPAESEDFKTWNGKTVAEILAHLAAKEELPSDVFSALIESKPDRFIADPDDRLTDISLFFPRPFLHLGHIPTDLLGHWAPAGSVTEKDFSLS